MSKSRWIVPVGPFLSVGVLVGLGFGIQWAFGSWSLWKNDGKVFFILHSSLEDIMLTLGTGK